MIAENQFLEFIIEIDKVKLKVQYKNIYKNRPTIIFLHDSLGCIKLWKNFPETLKTQVECNVFIYDRQGYGDSSPFSVPIREKNYLETETHVLQKIIERFRIAQPILFGHSDGGTIALIAASIYPKDVKAIIVEGAHVFVEEISLIGIQQAIKEYQTTDLRNKLYKYHGTKTDKVFSMWTDTWQSETFRDWNIEHLLSNITCPVLCIQGKNDEYGTVKQVEAIINQVSGPKYFFMPETGHTPHKTATKITLDKCKEFIFTIEKDMV